LGRKQIHGLRWRWCMVSMPALHGGKALTVPPANPNVEPTMRAQHMHMCCCSQARVTPGAIARVSP
jgi:hypothetical protein